MQVGRWVGIRRAVAPGKQVTCLHLWAEPHLCPAGVPTSFQMRVPPSEGQAVQAWARQTGAARRLQIRRRLAR